MWKNIHPFHPKQGNDILAEHSGTIECLRRPGFQLLKGCGGFSRFGGLPNLPSFIPWPTWKDDPLAFLCQIDLGEIPATSRGTGLPSRGHLFFFYDQWRRTSGYSPDDYMSWRVVYLDSSNGVYEQRQQPRDLLTTYKRQSIAYHYVDTYPAPCHREIEALELDDVQFNAYAQQGQALSAHPVRHQLCGHAELIQQDNPGLHCQVLAAGSDLENINGLPSLSLHWLHFHASDWVLLLQVDSDDKLGMMWGDAGNLGFWIRKQDIAACRFDAIWMLLQSS